jgi:hypothetical protein
LINEMIYRYGEHSWHPALRKAYQEMKERAEKIAAQRKGKVPALVASGQSKWEQVFGETDDDEAGEPVWNLTGLNMTVDFRTFPGRRDLDAPMLIYFQREEEHSPPKHWYAQNNYWIPTLSDLDRIAAVFGLHRIKGDSSMSKCIWTRPDGALVASQDVGFFEICTPLYLARGDSSELKQYLRQR